MFEKMIEKALGIKVGKLAEKVFREELEKREISVEFEENSIKIQTENYSFEITVLLDQLTLTAEKKQD